MWVRLTAALVLCSCASTSDPPRDAEAGKGSTSRKARAAFVASEIARWNAGLSAADRAEKFAAMKESAEAFLRGTDHLFWADQAGRKELARFGVPTWISGDLHLANLGAYDDDTGTVVLGMNDYDQAVVADYQLDVWRLATSLVLAGRAVGLDESDIQDGVTAFAEAYLDQLDDDRKSDDEKARRFTKKDFGGALDDFLGHAAKEDNVGKWIKDGKLDLSNENLAAVDAETAEAVAGALPAGVVDVARRLHAGLGSLGTRRYYALTDGGDILDVKAEQPAIAYAYGVAAMADEGERVETAERALDVEVDNGLTHVALGGASYVVRTLTPAKASLDDDVFADDFSGVCASLGKVIATFHARGDEDFDSAYVPYDFEAKVHTLANGHHDDFDALVVSVARSEADQVEADWKAWR